ncbi:transmembrane protein 207 [Otolemur garnettii]|uniref:transmembrane protein 207 n=1 Tax=Otolemur garnettii TaxID=30611 RepID=UPI0002741221|nr:transmembrane protein 207 [Otolemur garnettii]
MSRSRPLSVTTVISTTGTLCLPLFQSVLSDTPCEEKEMCVNYKGQHPNGWYIWPLLLVCSAALLCGLALFCLQCCLKPARGDSRRRTVAVFAVADADPIYGTEAAVSPTVGICLQTPNPELYPVPCFGTLNPPPSYEEIIKTSQF